MIILTIRTDQGAPELAVIDNTGLVARDTWDAQREMERELPEHVDVLLTKAGVAKKDIEGIVCYLGPGSFTSLRIGLTYANTLAYALEVPIVGFDKENWVQRGLEAIQAGRDDHVCLPLYGAEPRITTPSSSKKINT